MVPQTFRNKVEHLDFKHSKMLTDVIFIKFYLFLKYNVN